MHSLTDAGTYNLRVRLVVVDIFFASVQSLIMMSCYEHNFNMFSFIRCLQIEDEGQLQRATQNDQDSYEMQVRAANIVRLLILKMLQ